jgi:MOSC domain-containing protein YiiM
MSDEEADNARAKMIAPAGIDSATIESVRIGSITLLPGTGRGGRGIMTAYRKSPVSGPVAIGPTGLAGDSQGNPRVHGGPEKAVYAYPLSGYAGWAADFPTLAMGPGAMGENLVVTGVDEASIHIGDVIRAGTALLQVAQMREPCSTFAAIHGTTRVVRAMVKSGRCGWYCRVVEPGSVTAGDAHDIVDRPNPGWPVARLARFAAGEGGTIEALNELASLPGLSRYWQAKAQAELASQRAWP